MTLLFAHLSQDFVAYGSALDQVDINNPAAAQALQEARAQFRRSAARNAAWLALLGPYYPVDYSDLNAHLVLGVGIFATTFIFMNTWTYTAERMAKRIRERYLQAVMKQEIAFFDKVGAGEVTSRIENDTRE
jgi:ATP-binding cassette, subfamily B (MDR/TAP), member 1